MSEIDPDRIRLTAQILQDLHSCWMPHDGQIQIGKDLFYGKAKRVFVECGRKFGKQIALDEVIFTPNGFVRYGDLKVGDEVFDENGKVQTVTFLSDINYSPKAYEVGFCNGQKIKACAEHRWLTHTKLNRKSERRFPGSQQATVKTTQEIYDSLMWGKEFNHSIPYTKPLDLPEQELVVDPYILGVWLGDGGKSTGRFTNIDFEVIEEVTRLYKVNSYNYKEHQAYGLITDLKKIGLGTGSKFVPKEYLMGSIAQRLALLQGLMDTDGTINKRGNACSFDNTNKELSDAVFSLVASLGMKPIKAERVGKLYGVEHKRVYQVRFQPLLPVFKIKRKLDRISKPKKTLHHTIVSIKPIESVPMRCISVSGNSKLYLIGESLIPTHNTDDSVYTLNRFAAMEPNSHYYYIAPTLKQGGELVWENGRLPNFLKGALRDKYVHRIYEQDMRVVFKNGSFIKVDGAENYEAYRGINPHGIVYDEFKDHDERFHDAMEPNLAPHDAWLLILGTPPETEDNLFCRLAEEFKYDKESRYYNMPTETNPHISKDWLERQKQRLILRGDEHIWLREYMAKRVKSGQSYIFPMLKIPAKDNMTGKFNGYTEHVRPESELGHKIRMYYRDYDFHMAFDPGSSSCFAMIFAAVHRQTKKVLCIAEIYEKETARTSTKQIYPRAKEIANKFGIGWDRITKTYDNAAKWFANEVMYEFGEAIMPCSKDVKKKDVKLSVIKDFLLDGLLEISENCPKLIWEMENYKADDKGGIPKENDHLIDGLRYLFSAANINTVPKKRAVKDPDRRIEIEEEDWEFEEEEPIDFYPELEGAYDEY